jgi:CBS domain-containing protein
MTTSASTPTVNQNDHVAAAAYLMKHAAATALVILDGQWPGRPAGIITKADIARAAAAGEDLNNVRIRDLPLVSEKKHAMKAIAIDLAWPYHDQSTIPPREANHENEPDSGPHHAKPRASQAPHASPAPH